MARASQQPVAAGHHLSSEVDGSAAQWIRFLEKCGLPCGHRIGGKLGRGAVQSGVSSMIGGEGIVNRGLSDRGVTEESSALRSDVVSRVSNWVLSLSVLSK